MPGLATSVRDRRTRTPIRSTRPPRRGGFAAAQCDPAARLNSPLLAAGGFALPRLDGIPIQRRTVAASELGARTARALLEAGIANPNDWDGRDILTFVDASLGRFLEQHGAATIRRQFRLHVSLSASPDPSGMMAAEEEGSVGGRLYLSVDAIEAAYVVLGPALDLLSQCHPRLPVTFFREFIGSIDRWLRVYDYRDGLDHVTVLREWHEGDPEAEDYEYPDVEGAIPACMRLPVLSLRTVEGLCRKARNRKIRQILECLLSLKMASQTHQRPRIDEELQELLGETNPPLPALLAVFRPHDAIEGTFDAEAQSMLEVQPEPSMIVLWDVDSTESTAGVFAALGAMCRTLAAASKLTSLLPEASGKEE